MRIRRIAALCCLVLGGLFACHEGRSETALSGVDDLVEWFKIQQERVLPIAPPLQGPFLQRGFPDALPFDQDGMPYALLKKLPGYVEYDCPVYQIYLLEDPGTREILILNDRDKVIFAVASPLGYDPYAFVTAKYPDLYAGGYSADETAALLALYDPARIQVAVKLVPQEFYGNYVEADEQTTAPSASLFTMEGMESMGGSTSQLWVSAEGPESGRTNEVEVTAHLPTGFTNKVEVFAFDDRFGPFDGTNSVWLTLATDLQPAAGTNIVVWTNAPADDAEYRFYTAGSDYDEDGDGLSSAREILTYNSDASDIDTDDDGLIDGFDGLVSTNAYAGGTDADNDGYVDGEMDQATDPTDSDTTAPTITIDCPAGSSQLVWIP